MRSASKARNTRPPSIGKAGIRLNTTRNRFAVASRASSPEYGSCGAMLSAGGRPPRKANRTPAITTFTAGPARATTSSCFGSSGMRSSRATPPMGSKVTSGVWMP